ncbi:MFS transporter, partial [Nocardioides sp.]|uniref:MFS transporter n=1 Tax=Nocardioides sp. TaxID=35761 RepID=UPI0027368684
MSKIWISNIQLERERGGHAAAWIIAFGLFTLVTTELFPVVVLNDIAHDLGVSAGTAGLTVTVPGLVAAAAAPMVAARAQYADRRSLLVALLLLVAAGNLVTAVAPTILPVLLARVAVGIGIGGFWALAAGLAPQLVSEDQVGRASSVIFGGAAAATVVGVPLSGTVADVFDWRVSAVMIAALGATAALSIPLVVPSMPVGAAETTGPPGTGRAMRLAVGRNSTVLLVTLLIVVGHFTAFTFLAPVLENLAGVAPPHLPAVVLGYGAAALVGTFLAGRVVATHPRRAAQVVAATLALVVGSLALVGAGILAVAAVLVWGLFWGAVGVTLQLWLLRSSGPHADLATSAYVSVFNVSIAGGSALGGL